MTEIDWQNVISCEVTFHNAKVKMESCGGVSPSYLSESSVRVLTEMATAVVIEVDGEIDESALASHPMMRHIGDNRLMLTIPRYVTHLHLYVPLIGPI